MASFHLHNHLPKICALMAAILILPGLAFAGHDHGKGNDDENNGRENNRKDKDIPVVPEANAGWVLIPFFGAVLLFSWRRISHAQA